ncbi:MAG: carboxypeptidase regulatory-like domain-containing protein [Bacteroidales bacterium]|nr:carboxypeptidase regulatory-like domain-containing protein [Bacteroidales bacterium]
MKKLSTLIMLLAVFNYCFASAEKDESVTRSGLKRTAALMSPMDDNYFEEGFEGVFPPANWVMDPVSGESGAWAQDDGTSYGSGAAFDGTYAAMFNNYNYSTDTQGSLISPELDLSAATAPQLHFVWWNNDGSYSPAKLTVYTSVDGASYVQLLDIETCESGEESWVTVSKYLTSDVKYVKFTATSDYGMKNTFIDNVYINEGPAGPSAAMNMEAAQFPEIAVGSSIDPWGDAFVLSNQGSEDLIINSITDLSGTEFSTNFDASTVVPMEGSYAFGFEYAPVDTDADVVSFEINTNGGVVTVELTGNGYVLADNIVEIGSALEVDQHLPVVPNHAFSYSQSIFKSEELNLSGKQIEKIYYHFNGGEAIDDEIAIYMGHTDDDEFAAWLPLSEMTLVYQGQMTSDAVDNWIEFVLPMPFEYDNTKNLVVAVDENTEGAHGANCDFFCTNAGVSMSAIGFGSTDVDPANPNSSSTMSLTYRPNIRFEYADFVAIQDGIVQGTVTNAVTSQPIEGATVSIALQTTETAADGSYSIEIAEGTHELTISAPGYFSFVQDVVVTPGTPVTVDAALAVDIEVTYNILEEGFEDASIPPMGWSQYQMGDAMGWVVWPFEFEGAWSARYYGDMFGDSDDYLVTPQLQIIGEARLKFRSWMGEPDYCTVHVSTGSPDPADGDYVQVLNLPDQGMGWNLMNIDLSAYAGEYIYIAFRGMATTTDGPDWTIDNVVVEQTVQTGMIAGTVTLDGGNGNVENVTVSAGGVSVHPNADGTYEIQIGAAAYTVVAQLNGYESAAAAGVQVVAGQTVENNDFTLIAEPVVINPPKNVSVDANTGIVTWEAPELAFGFDELAYEDGDPSFAVNEYGRAFGVHMNVNTPCQLMSLKYFTYCEIDTLQFEAFIYNMEGGQPTYEILWSNLSVRAAMGNWTEIDLSGHNLMMDGDFIPCMVAWEPIALFADIDQSNGRAWDGYSVPWTLTNNTYYIRAVVKYPDGSMYEIDQNGNREIINYNVYLDNMVSPVFNEISWQAEQFQYLETGSNHVAGVSAVYEAGESEIFEVPFTYMGLTPGVRGTVTLAENGNGSVNDVELFINNQIISPNASGAYSINLEPGTYTITASLENYEQVIIDEIEVNPAEKTEINIDMISYLGVGDNAKSSFGLTSIYPVPVNGNATIAYQVEEAQNIDVNIYNMNGQLVNKLVSDFRTAGSYQYNWNATNMNGSRVKPGVYMVEVAGQQSSSRSKIIVL